MSDIEEQPKAIYVLVADVNGDPLPFIAATDRNRDDPTFDNCEKLYLITHKPTANDRKQFAEVKKVMSTMDDIRNVLDDYYNTSGKTISKRIYAPDINVHLIEDSAEY